MKISDFGFELPNALIARYPTKNRTDSRLLHVQSGSSTEFADHTFSQIETLLHPGDLLVLNNTRVMPARLYGCKSTGGKIELLIERVIDETRCLAHIKASKAPKVGSTLEVDVGSSTLQARVVARHEGLFELLFDIPIQSLMQQGGHIPLPPYIDREDEAVDVERYQTVYAKHTGAVAAPTAGLHFDEALLRRLQQRGIHLAYVTLHVGAGTFQPVRVESVTDHRMHSEYMEVSQAVCDAVADTQRAGKRVVAVGTTSVRALESAAQEEGSLRPYQGDTDIFIYPGYQFRVVDALITNFHLPESSLMLLVSAFAGIDTIKAAYTHAIDQAYRFYSYGDAMFIDATHSHSQSDCA